MAEDIQVQEPQQSAVSPEIAQLMELSLNGPKAAPVQPEVVEGGQPGAAVIEEQQAAAPADVFAPFKEKFGYQSPEDAMKEIEELRGFKAAPPVTQPAFENEVSRQLFEAIQKGDKKQVYQVLAQQERLEDLTTKEVTKDTAAEIIKMGMQLKYKDLTNDEINYRFNKQFALPKEPVQDKENGEDDLDFSLRKQEWQDKVNEVEMDKIIEAKLARPELDAAKSKIVLPEFNADVDEAYLQYQKQLEDRPKLEAEIQAAYKAFTPKAIETKLPFTDEANKIAFEFQYEPDGESFNKSVDMATDIKKFFESFVKPDGTPDRQGFLSALHFALNAKSIISEAMKQTKNATIKSFLPDNSQPGGQRQSPQTQEVSELDKMMQQSLAPYQRR